MNTDKLPPIDPARTYLEILEDTLSILLEHPPERTRGPNEPHSYEIDCAECGFPLTGCVASNANHAEERCKYLRVVAELEAWVRVERQLKAEKQEAEEENCPDCGTDCGAKFPDGCHK